MANTFFLGGEREKMEEGKECAGSDNSFLNLKLIYIY